MNPIIIKYKLKSKILFSINFSLIIYKLLSNNYFLIITCSVLCIQGCFNADFDDKRNTGFIFKILYKKSIRSDE